MNTHVQLILFFFLAIIFNVLQLVSLGVVLMAILPWLILSNNQHFYRLLKRLKWFFAVMLFIYMFNTPGQYILSWPFSFQPTYEGLLAGCLQLLRIVLIVAMLSVIYQQNTKQTLVSGIYALIKPLHHVGLNVDRFTARLWLTLFYVDSPDDKLKIQSISGLFDVIHQVLSQKNTHMPTIIIHHQEYDLKDYLMLLLVVLLFVYTLYQV